MSYNIFDHEQLYLKAKAFTSRAMDDDGDVRSFDEQAMWAALALELLGKAALSRVSPLLIADPSDDGGHNLLSAAGVIDSGKIAKTVTASTVWKRCARTFKPFDDNSATRFADNRNSYLHGSAAAFTSAPPHSWWPRYWNLVVILLQGMDKTIDDYVGIDRAEIVEAHLEQNKLNVETQANARIARARQRLAQWRNGTLPASVANQWRPGIRNLSNDMPYAEPYRCFICEKFGILEGEDAVFDYDDDGGLFGTVDTLAFSCDYCGLDLDTPELLAAAAKIEPPGFPTTFDVEADFEPEYDYGND